MNTICAGQNNTALVIFGELPVDDNIKKSNLSIHVMNVEDTIFSECFSLD